MPIYLLTVYGCLVTKMSELSNCDTEHEDHKAESIYYLAFYTKSLSTLAVDNLFLIMNFG